MLYKFDVKVTEKDYYDFNIYHSITSPDVKKPILKWKLYVPILFLILFIFRVIRGEDWSELANYLTVFVPVSAIWFFGFKPFITLYINLNYKSLKKKNNLDYSENSKLEFYTDSFTEITDKTTIQMQYSAIPKVRINKNKAIYIYHTPVTGVIIPFETFATEEQRNDFIEFISKKMEK